MTALMVLGILGLTALFLAGLFTYLYRWRVRKRLFPQLPRLWRRDRSRFFISSAFFVISLLVFMVVSLATGPSLPDSPQKPAVKKEQGPSFDGAPPPPMPQTPPPQTAVTAPSVTTLSPQTALPTPTPGDQTGPMAKHQQTVPSTPQVQRPSTVQAPSPIPPPVKEQSSQQSSQISPKVQSSQALQTKPKAETPFDKPAPEKTVTAPSNTAELQAQPTQIQAQPKVDKKITPPGVKPQKADPFEQATKPQETKVPAKVKSLDKAFTVCVASFQNRETAQRYIVRLANKGRKGKIMKVELEGKGVWYRICLGEFASSKQAAEKAKAWRNNEMVKTPFVVRLR